MKYILALLLFMPTCVFAHAVPIFYTPDHGALLTDAPKEIFITYSDTIVPGSATLTLHNGTWTPRFLVASVESADSRTIRAELPQVSGGVTIVWGVTSGDDGHYTHGALNFAVADAHVRESSVAAQRQDVANVAMLLFGASGLLIVLCLVFLYIPLNVSAALSCTLLWGLACAVVGFLSTCLYTLPPATWEKEATEGNISVRLSSTLGEGNMQLTILSNEILPDPIFEIGNREEGVDPMPVVLSSVSRDDEGATYSFPTSVFVPPGSWHVSTTFVRENHYDAHGSMTIEYPNDIAAANKSGPQYTPQVLLAIFVALCALVTFVCCIVLLRRKHATKAKIEPTE